jgi:two-component system sensor histidine kinase HydH
LAAGVAHEIRNPLTAIKMLVQAQVEDTRESGLPTGDLEVIEQEIRRIERRIQIFLDFARPPRPGHQLLDLSSAAEQALALVSGRARRQEVALELRGPGVPVVVEADEDQVRQLLVNLALNALDAMPEGGTLTVELRPPEGGRAELHVSDTGPGIPPEVLPRIFEPFVSGKEAGTGLGLAISRRIAEGHGGSLRVVQHPRAGARFVLRLPARTGADSPSGTGTVPSRGLPA